MAQYSIGDLAQSTLTRMHSTRLKVEMLKLTQELSSGTVADIGRHLGGDMGYFADVEAKLRMLDGFDLAAGEAGLFADSTQSVLDRINATLEQSLPVILPTVGTGPQDMRDGASERARADIVVIVNALNTSASGRSLFSGTATDQAPLISGDGFLDTLKAALPPIADAATLIAEVGIWFSDPAGFDATAYQGSSNDLSPVQISEEDRVAMGLRADAPELKAVLESLAIAALATDPDYGFDLAEQTATFEHATNALISSQAGVTALQASYGAAQERIETASTRNALSRMGYEEARAALIGADPFDVATRLEDVQVRLEALYAVTSRMSRLSLVNYI